MSTNEYVKHVTSTEIFDIIAIILDNILFLNLIHLYK